MVKQSFIKRSLLLPLFLLSFSVAVVAQDGLASQTNSPSRRSSEYSEQDIALPPDMKARILIERAESEHRKILEDVEKLCNLSGDVTKRYQEQGRLSSEEVKKIGTIEKLAKRILSHAGGDQVEDKTGKSDQMSLADALDKMNAAVAVIKKDMTRETRHVVSATVIASSNEVIELAQFLRRAQK